MFVVYMFDADGYYVLEQILDNKLFDYLNLNPHSLNAILLLFFI